MCQEINQGMDHVGLASSRWYYSVLIYVVDILDIHK